VAAAASYRRIYLETELRAERARTLRAWLLLWWRTLAGASLILETMHQNICAKKKVMSEKA